MFDDPFSPKKRRKGRDPFEGILGIGSGKKSRSRPKREPVSRSQKNEVLARQKNKCARCKKPLDMRATHFDHIKEVYKGGKSTISNLQALCANCHNIKTHNDKLKRTEKKKAQARRKKSDSQVIGLFGPEPKGKKKNPFDFGF